MENNDNRSKKPAALTSPLSLSCRTKASRLPREKPLHSVPSLIHTPIHPDCVGRSGRVRRDDQMQTAPYFIVLHPQKKRECQIGCRCILHYKETDWRSARFLFQSAVVMS